MITYDDVVRNHPQMAREGAARDAMQKWIDTANRSLPDSRFKKDENPDYGRTLFVAHQVTKGLPNLAQAFTPNRGNVAPRSTKLPHPWTSTEHGKLLKGMTAY